MLAIGIANIEKEHMAVLINGFWKVMPPFDEMDSRGGRKREETNLRSWSNAIKTVVITKIISNNHVTDKKKKMANAKGYGNTPGQDNKEMKFSAELC